MKHKVDKRAVIQFLFHILPNNHLTTSLLLWSLILGLFLGLYLRIKYCSFSIFFFQVSHDSRSIQENSFWNMKFRFLMLSSSITSQETQPTVTSTPLFPSCLSSQSALSSLRLEGQDDVYNYASVLLLFSRPEEEALALSSGLAEISYCEGKLGFNFPA